MTIKKIDYVKAIVKLESTKLNDEQLVALNIIKKYVKSIENKIETKNWRSNMKEQVAV